MKWTTEKLLAFKAHFVLTDRQIAKGIGITHKMAWSIRNGEVDIGRYSAPLTAFMESVRAGKIAEAEKMIEYFKSF